MPDRCRHGPRAAGSQSDRPRRHPRRACTIGHLRTVEIRWRDLDACGHVNNAVYSTYLEVCRDEYLGRLLGASYVRDFVVARVAVDFVEELRQQDSPVAVSVRLAAVGRASLTLHEEIRKPEQGRLCARAETIVVARDPESRRSRPLTGTERAACERALEPVLAGGADAPD